MGKEIDIPQKRPRKGLKIALAVLGVLILLVAATYLAAGVKVQVKGSSELILTNAAPYEEAGATVTFRSLWASDQELSASDALMIQGEVNDKKPGDYTLTYVGHHLVWVSFAQRTVHVKDTAAPVITLTSVPGAFTPRGETYQEEGFTALDDYDGDVTSKVERQVGEDQVVYTVADSSGNTVSVTRTILHEDPLPPELTLKGDSHITLRAGTAYEEPGYTAVDLVDGDLTSAVEVEGLPDIYRAGEYTVTYTATDAAGNAATATRTVTVEAIRQPDQVNPGSNVVYLTFDDGPSGHTSELLDLLARYNVKATFFVTANGDTSLIAREAAEGHAVGVHTATHNYSSVYASEDAYWSDFEYMESIIVAQTGSRTTLMRFPGGSSNTVSSFNPGIMTRLVESANNLGYQYFDWNVSSGDAGSTTDTDTVAENIIDGISSRSVSVVLQHDTQGFSVAAVEKVIVWGLSNGYTFLPLSPSSPTCHHGVNN